MKKNSGTKDPIKQKFGLYGKTIGYLKISDHQIIRIFYMADAVSKRLSIRKYHWPMSDISHKGRTVLSIPLPLWGQFFSLLRQFDEEVFDMRQEKST